MVTDVMYMNEQVVERYFLIESMWKFTTYEEFTKVGKMYLQSIEAEHKQNMHGDYLITRYYYTVYYPDVAITAVISADRENQSAHLVNLTY